MRQPQEERVELKFPLDAELANAVRMWATEHLDRDPFTLRGQDYYSIQSVYCDTPEHDIARRTDKVGLTKFRIRRYDHGSELWLESKRKQGCVVRKSRTSVDRESLQRQLAQLSPDASWCGTWFVEQLRKRGLQANMNVEYRRFARVSMLDGQPQRLTIDDAIRTAVTNEYVPHKIAANEPTLTHEHVLELKFNGTLPPLFKQLLMTFPLHERGFSKYGQAYQQRFGTPGYAGLAVGQHHSVPHISKESP